MENEPPAVPSQEHAATKTEGSGISPSSAKHNKFKRSRMVKELPNSKDEVAALETNHIQALTSEPSTTQNRTIPDKAFPATTTEIANLETRQMPSFIAESPTQHIETVVEQETRVEKAISSPPDVVDLFTHAATTIMQTPRVALEQVTPLVAQKPEEESKQNKRWLEIVLYLLPLVALALWYLALKDVHIRQMNDLGLISVFPPTLIAAMFLVTVSFCFVLYQPKIRPAQLILYFSILIFMLYAVSIVVEEMPRFSIVYRHEGYTEFIMRTGTTDPNLDAYFSWPGFFSLTAFLTKLAGYPDILNFAGWSPVFYNAIYFGPLYMIFRAFTEKKRVVWLAIWIFYLTNWIGQDYFSPQGFNFFLYLAILAISLTWLKSDPEAPVRPLSPRLAKIPFMTPLYQWLRTPDRLIMPSQPRQRIALVACILIIFGFSTFSHQLSPFFIIASVGILVITRRIRFWWLPVAMIVIEAAWILLMTQTFLAGHSDALLGGLTHILSSFTQNVSDRVTGNPQHNFIARIRLIMSGVVWLTAGIAAWLRWRQGHKDATILLLALTPFPLFIIQPYGGEMLLRCYLFALPPMTFLMATLLYNIPWLEKRFLLVIGNGLLCALLMGGFFFTRYGNESMDYMTYDEVNGLIALYDMAPDQSFFLDAWQGVPWQIKGFEKYSLDTVSAEPALIEAVGHGDVNTVARFMQQKKVHGSAAYIIFSRSSKQTYNVLSGYPAGSLDTFEQKVQSSGEFNLVFRNQDVQIYQFVALT
ncbi:hypothetical protein [Tengunoibacter tsumagoiensis]|uniref:Uncharacterized protein n=1 Tax=Tengunoibacter tsumagoiensis TaxID=2014871 RepID=A0A401ZXZ2_9CHLR|nr:hypothetical protein [Tengunoibacter tsumagoiensis]GCE11738.1 hypothetical protein KTT_15970 [Tengunoibacter tsumagoiensis]